MTHDIYIPNALLLARGIALLAESAATAKVQYLGEQRPADVTATGLSTAC